MKELLEIMEEMDIQALQDLLVQWALVDQRDLRVNQVRTAHLVLLDHQVLLVKEGSR